MKYKDVIKMYNNIYEEEDKWVIRLLFILLLLYLMNKIIKKKSF